MTGTVPLDLSVLRAAAVAAIAAAVTVVWRAGMERFPDNAIARAARTFVQAFAGVYAIPQLVDAAGGGSLVDVSLLRSAIAAGVTAPHRLRLATVARPQPHPEPAVEVVSQPTFGRADSWL